MNRANPKIVGSFIIGGSLLLLVAIAALVSGRFFTKSTTFVAFFPESVRGLQIGSPVTFRGVPLGQVTAIEAFMSKNKDINIDIKVTFQVDLDRIHDPSGVVRQLRQMGPEEVAKTLAEDGLRAELQSTSLVTGQLYIDLDFHPNLAPRYVEVAGLHHPQIPTAPTKMQQIGDRIQRLTAALADLPVDTIAANVNETLVAIRELVRNPEIQRLLASAGQTSKELARTLNNVDRLVGEVRGKVDGVDLVSVVNELNTTLKSAQKGLSQMQDTLKGTGGTQREISATLSEVSRAAAAIRVLAEYLEQNPSAILEGKKP